MRKQKKPKNSNEIEFDYIKSNFFRVIRADGAFGGLAPNGSIHMAIYSERQAIPTKTVHVLEGSNLGPEVREKREGRKAVVREVEVDVVLEVQQAILLRDWLIQKIKQHETLVGNKPRETTAVERKAGKVTN